MAAAASELVPQTESVADVYCTDSSNVAAPDQQDRFDGLVQEFNARYGHLPDFVARSPGRVNIIGEHIDYSLYDVLPTALRVDVLIAVKVVPTEGKESVVKLANSNQKFSPTQFSVPNDREVDIDAATHDWDNYFKAGLRVAVKFLRERAPDKDAFVPASIEAIVNGNVPPGGGVSSSAALVCSSALAVVKANGHDVTKQDLQDMAIVSERAVGVYSGGMDQAASIFSRRGYLLYTRFFPTFHVEDVPIPKPAVDFTFMVAQSFVTSNKAVTAPKHYNLRVAECTLAAVTLAKHHGVVLQKDSSSLGYSLRNFQEELMRKEGRLHDPLEYQIDSVIQAASDLFTKEEGYTRAEMAQMLSLSTDELEKQFLSSFPVQAERFLLRQRSLHCFKEARRVLDFKACMTKNKDHLSEQDIKYLGQLLNESQASCRYAYDCSCPEINEICDIALRAGALGSRLTGAGWGGSTVHMIPQAKVEAVTEALKKEYYAKRFPDLSEEKLRDAMVISKPSNGTFVITGAAIANAV